MTNEEASNILDDFDVNFEGHTAEEVAEAFDVAFRALEQEPCDDWHDVPSDEMTLEQARQAVKDLRKKLSEYLEQEPCENCISREAVEKITWEEPSYTDPLNVLTEIREKVRSLPSVTPKEKTGHWRHYEGMLICSECGTEFYDDIMEYCGDDVPKCCPNCGAKMVESQESEVRNDC